MAEYAKTTTVTPDKSRDEIINTLKRYGCTDFGFMVSGKHNVNIIQFELHGRMVRLNVPLPNEVKLPRGSRTTPAAALEQSKRQRWRAMALYVKAMCEAIENKVATVDQAFFPFLVLANGQTMSEWAAPQIQTMIDGGKLPPMLPGI